MVSCIPNLNLRLHFMSNTYIVSAWTKINENYMMDAIQLPFFLKFVMRSVRYPFGALKTLFGGVWGRALVESDCGVAEQTWLYSDMLPSVASSLVMVYVYIYICVCIHSDSLGFSTGRDTG